MRRSLGTREPGPAELEIGRMRRRHLKGIMAIERQVYPRPWSPSLFLAEMSEQSNRTYLVARIGRDVVGYAGLICYGDEAHVTTIAVDPDHHRRKIGTRLMYGRFGFRPVGVRKNYYQETNEDALIMWVDDVNGTEYQDLLGRLADLAAPSWEGS